MSHKEIDFKIELDKTVRNFLLNSELLEINFAMTQLKNAFIP